MFNVKSQVSGYIFMLTAIFDWKTLKGERIKEPESCAVTPESISLKNNKAHGPVGQSDFLRSEVRPRISVSTVAQYSVAQTTQITGPV